MGQDRNAFSGTGQEKCCVGQESLQRVVTGKRVGWDRKVFCGTEHERNCRWDWRGKFPVGQDSKRLERLRTEKAW